MVYYYDATALGSNYAVNGQDFHWVVVHEFERNGWAVNDVYLGNPMRHDENYLLINQGFAGKQRLMRTLTAKIMTTLFLLYNQLA